MSTRPCRALLCPSDTFLRTKSGRESAMTVFVNFAQAMSLVRGQEHSSVVRHLLAALGLLASSDYICASFEVAQTGALLAPLLGLLINAAVGASIFALCPCRRARTAARARHNTSPTPRTIASVSVANDSTTRLRVTSVASEVQDIELRGTASAIAGDRAPVEAREQSRSAALQEQLLGSGSDSRPSADGSSSSSDSDDGDIKEGRRSVFIGRLAKTSLYMLLFVFVDAVRYPSTMWFCTTIDGQRVLNAYTTLECGSAAHVWLTVLATVMFGVFGAGTVTLVAALLVVPTRFRRRLGSVDVRFLQRKYSRNAPWYEAVAVARRLLLVVVSQMPQEGPLGVLKAALLQLVLVAWLSIHVRVWPYRVRSANVLEMIGIVLAFLVHDTNLVFTYGDVAATRRAGLDNDGQSATGTVFDIAALAYAGVLSVPVMYSVYRGPVTQYVLYWCSLRLHRAHMFTCRRH